MKKIFYQSTGFLSAICGSLFITLPAIPQTALAQQQQQPSVSPTSQVNPCPSIFYLEPHNSRVLVPQGCPPNAYTQKQKNQVHLLLPILPHPINKKRPQVVVKHLLHPLWLLPVLAV